MGTTIERITGGTLLRMLPLLLLALTVALLLTVAIGMLEPQPVSAARTLEEELAFLCYAAGGC